MSLKQVLDYSSIAGKGDSKSFISISNNKYSADKNKFSHTPNAKDLS